MGKERADEREGKREEREGTEKRGFWIMIGKDAERSHALNLGLCVISASFKFSFFVKRKIVTEIFASGFLWQLMTGGRLENFGILMGKPLICCSNNRAYSKLRTTESLLNGRLIN